MCWLRRHCWRNAFWHTVHTYGSASPAVGGAESSDSSRNAAAQSFFQGSMSPMHLLRDSTSNARWLEDNINDFSLTSLLGHLDEIDATRDILVS